MGIPNEFKFYLIFLLEGKLPYDPVCPSVGWLICWSVGWLVCQGGEFHFHAPIGALIDHGRHINPTTRSMKLTKNYATLFALFVYCLFQTGIKQIVNKWLLPDIIFCYSFAILLQLHPFAILPGFHLWDLIILI